MQRVEFYGRARDGFDLNDENKTAEDEPINNCNYILLIHEQFKMQKIPPKLRLKLANECDNIIERVKMCPATKEHKFYLIHSKQLNDVVLRKLMALFELLMREMYESSSWGWNEPEKLSEWRHQRSRIIIVTDSQSNNDLIHPVQYNCLPNDDEKIIGFMCIRFESGSNKKECSLYVYELHVSTEHQRQGLGADLMSMAQALATEFKMDKIMLTVFRSNDKALAFYKKLKFKPDESSPAPNEADYVILSYKVRSKT